MASDVKAIIVRVPTMLFPDKGREADLRSGGSASFSIPLGAIYVATYARKIGGHDVEILDLNIPLKLNSKKSGMDGVCSDPLKVVEKELITMVNAFKPQIVGFSAIFLYDKQWTLYCADIVKKMDNRITVLVGGSLATIWADLILASGSIDYAVMGEGERVFNNLLDSYPDQKKIHQLKGIAYKERGNIFKNEPEALIQDLDTIPMPDLGLVPLDLYPKDEGGNDLYLFTSRGCPFHCTFCSAYRLWGRGIRYHSPGRVLVEIKRFRDIYGIRKFWISDDNFTLDRLRLKEICELLEEENAKSGIFLRWKCSNGLMIATLSPEIVQTMHAAGCTEFTIAVESGSERVAREILHKPIDYGKALKIRNAIRELGATLTSFYMLGLPGETIEEMNQTVDFMAKLESDWNEINIYAAIPDTELYKKAVEIGILHNDVPLPRYCTTLSTKDFSKEDVKRIQYDANIKYNFLRNRNVLGVGNGLRPDAYRARVEHVVAAYPKHIIGKIVLGYLSWREGFNEGAEFWWESAQKDLNDPMVQRDFGSYLELRDELPIKQWLKFIDPKKQNYHF